MGSVPHLYTSGDNDDEIVPVQYYRHYLYCDACGSFELASWMAPSDRETPEDLETLDQRRQRLGKAAIFSALLALVAGWLAIGLVPSPAVLVLLPTAIALLLVARGVFWKAVWGASGTLEGRWRFFKATLPWLVIVAVAQWFASDFYLPHWLLVVTGSAVAIGLLVWREVLSSRAVSRRARRLGMRCTQCEATYANDSAFFTDLDANPRDLTLDEVPRPLGSSTFLKGESVESVPGEEWSRFPT